MVHDCGASSLCGADKHEFVGVVEVDAAAPWIRTMRWYSGELLSHGGGTCGAFLQESVPFDASWFILGGMPGADGCWALFVHPAVHR